MLTRLPRAAHVAIIFALAGVIMLGAAAAIAIVIENRTREVVTEKLAEAKIDWITLKTDGMQLHITGMAPNESQRFRALNVIGSTISSSRIRDSLEVSPTTALAPPRFSVEMLRNDDGIQLIGLLPETAGEGALGLEGLLEATSALTPEGTEPTNMLNAAAWPAPANWDKALRFGIEALSVLKRSKVSVGAERVEVTAITSSEAEKRRVEAELRRKKPEGVYLVTDISAPRPVITPFTLRFIKDAEGARFDACSADTERSRATILAAARGVGAELPADCTIGLGVPTPRWAEGVAAAIHAVDKMGAGSVTFSDADVTFTAGQDTSQADFDLALGELRAGLPDVFSLEAIAPRPDQVAQGPAEFTATLAAGGRVQLRGRLVDEMQQSAVEAFAHAAFNASGVYVATRLDPELPDGWPIRVLAGLQSLSLLSEGSLLVRADLVQVSGVTGHQDARQRITQILSARLGQGQTFQVEVRYDKKLDPTAALPTPQECLAEVDLVMTSGKITFTPGSAEITSDAGPLIGNLADVLKTCPGLPLEISGHTDSQGSDSGNLALSQARAEAVLMALQGRRVDVSAMVAKGYGEVNPIADNGTESGREANRRIEFELLAGAITPAPAPTGSAAVTPAEPGTSPATEALPEIILEDPDDVIPLGEQPDDEIGVEGEGDDEPPAELPPAPESAPAPETAPDPEESEPAAEPSAAAATVPAAESIPAVPAPEAEITAPDFSHDTSPSLAPTEMTIRPLPRPARGE